MGYQHNVIVEGLRTKREAANGKPRLTFQAVTDRKPLLDPKRVISEKTWRNFSKDKGGTRKVVTIPKSIKESMFKVTGETETGMTATSSTIFYENGDVFIGATLDEQPDGEGVMVSPDGDLYVGEWRIGRQHGRGYYLWADRRMYVGTWVNGVRHGAGSFYIDGESYNVEYDNGKMLVDERKRR
jgi:hypothetical protein